MSVRQRILAIRLGEKIARQPEYAERLGISQDETKRSFTVEEVEQNEKGDEVNE